MIFGIFLFLLLVIVIYLLHNAYMSLIDTIFDRISRIECEQTGMKQNISNMQKDFYKKDD